MALVHLSTKLTPRDDSSSADVFFFSVVVFLFKVQYFQYLAINPLSEERLNWQTSIFWSCPFVFCFLHCVNKKLKDVGGVGTICSSVYFFHQLCPIVLPPGEENPPSASRWRLHVSSKHYTT